MKNILRKKSNKRLTIGAAVAGIAVAGGLAWLFFTKGGARAQANWKASLKNSGKDFAAGLITEQTGVPKDITRAAADAMID
ncbi:hypothetical protein [Mucilaginibacter pedocola]|uniref:Uncharacterized protein n=1 Tax=Mucilaginibacter pedocola TaxID=1792845 RepID=A0A1S9PKN8_9SPHI|nr:hypothetical protein [Mucilaginibacter pedocola]OOQ61511.1 hypothetical protein BC343_00060 [Mucilaginibacter pedocola]